MSQVEKFEKKFHQPEMFVRMGRSIMALPLPDDKVKKAGAPVMDGNIDIEKAKEYQDIVEEYYPIETIVYGIKNIKQEFIENGRKEIYKRTYKD